jgi:hypothetical protein
MQTFGTVTAASQGIVDRGVGQDGGVFVDHRALSYLPLAHASERAWVECRTLLSGRGHLFFTESLATFIDDLKRARPTIFVSVPRLWSKFQQSVFARIPPAQLDAMLDNPALAADAARAVQLGVGCRGARRHRLGADSAGANDLVQTPRTAPVRGLWDDRGLRLLARLERLGPCSGTRGLPDAWRADARRRRRRDPREVTGPDGGLLQGTGADG